MPCYTATSNLKRAHNKFNPTWINSCTKIIQYRPNLVQKLTICVDFSTYSQISPLSLRGGDISCSLRSREIKEIKEKG